MWSTLLFLASALPLSQAETVLGVYIFHRHGDRTAKSTPPTNLTGLGYQQVFTAGTYFRNRYITSDASSRIAGINSDVVKLSQLNVSAPLDSVLMSSAVGFTQALYPASDQTAQKLRNGTTVQAPLNGYQIIPIQQTTSGTGSEDSAWLQGSSNCANALTSSNSYFETDDYTNLLQSTQDVYNQIIPVVNQTFTTPQTSFKNAYTIFDLLNVANIHNATIQSSDLLTSNTLARLRTLADVHEFNLAYNDSDPVRAVAGATLAAQVVEAFQDVIARKAKTKLAVQFGAYGTFQSFFGLANLTKLGDDWIGVPDYASSMTWELFTNGSASPFPDPKDMNVRFLFHNGTASNSSEPQPFPLFGQTSPVLSWTDFQTAMNKFAIGNQASWCQACGNTTGVCAGQAGPNGDQGQSGGSNGGVSPAVGGVIGAFVTLAVVCLAGAFIMLCGGVRLYRKSTLRVANQPSAPKGE